MRQIRRLTSAASSAMAASLTGSGVSTAKDREGGVNIRITDKRQLGLSGYESLHTLAPSSSCVWVAYQKHSARTTMYQFKTV